jgi:hypothetical protein
LNSAFIYAHAAQKAREVLQIKKPGMAPAFLNWTL